MSKLTFESIRGIDYKIRYMKNTSLYLIAENFTKYLISISMHIFAFAY